MDAPVPERVGVVFARRSPPHCKNHDKRGGRNNFLKTQGMVAFGKMALWGILCLKNIF